MPKIASLSRHGQFKLLTSVVDGLTERLPAVSTGLVAHFPLDGTLKPAPLASISADQLVGTRHPAHADLVKPSGHQMVTIPGLIGVRILVVEFDMLGAVNGGMPVHFMGSNGTASYFDLYINANRIGMNTWNSEYWGPVMPAASQRTRVTYVFDTANAANNKAFYDGVEQAMGGTPVVGAWPVVSDVVRVGAGTSTNTYPFNGYFGNIRFYAYNPEDVEATETTLDADNAGLFVGQSATNLALNADGTRRFSIGILTSATTVTDLGNNRFRLNGTAGGAANNVRIYWPDGVLVNGETYTTSFKYKILGGSKTLSLINDFCDVSLSEEHRKRAEGPDFFWEAGSRARATYDSTFRFTDLSIPTGLDIEIWDIQLTRSFQASGRVAGTPRVGANSKLELGRYPLPGDHTLVSKRRMIVEAAAKHVALTKSGSQFKLYENGVESAEPSYGFTRASAASLGNQLVGTHVLRLPVIDGVTGAFVEEPTTNLLTANQSRVETDTTGLAISGGGSMTIARDTGEAWEGLASLKVTTYGEVSAQGMITGNITATASTTYTVSAWVKGSGSVLPVLVHHNSGTYTGGTNGTPVTLTDEWQRISVTGVTGSTANQVALQVITNGAQATTFWVDGLQIEQKAYATTWTQGTTTRAGDVLTLATAGALRPDQGAVIIEAYLSRLTASDRYLIRIPDASGGFYIIANTNGKWQARPGGGAAIISNDNVTTGAHTVGITWDAGSYELWLDGQLLGALEGTSPYASFAASATLGAYNSTAGYINDSVRKVVTYLTKLSAADMKAATLGKFPPGHSAKLDFSDPYTLTRSTHQNKWAVYTYHRAATNYTFAAADNAVGTYNGDLPDTNYTFVAMEVDKLSYLARTYVYANADVRVWHRYSFLDANGQIRVNGRDVQSANKDVDVYIDLKRGWNCVELFGHPLPTGDDMFLLQDHTGGFNEPLATSGRVTPSVRLSQHPNVMYMTSVAPLDYFTPPTVNPVEFARASVAHDGAGMLAKRWSVSENFWTDNSANWAMSQDAGSPVVTWNTTSRQLEFSAGAAGGANQATYVQSSFSADDVVIETTMTQAADSGIVARWKDQSNYYLLLISDNTQHSTINLVIYKRVANIFSNLGTVDCPFVRGTEATVRLEVVGSSLKAYFDGELKLSLTDTSISGTGKVGMRQNSIATPAHFTSFKAGPVINAPRLAGGTEVSSANLIAYSETFTSTMWTKSAVTASDQVVMAPDGTLSGGRVLETTANSAHWIYQGGTPSISARIRENTDYVNSVYVKGGLGRDWVFIRTENKANSSKFTWFNLRTGTVGTNQNTTAGIEPAGNGWWRIWAGNNSGTGASGNNPFLVGPAMVDGASSFVGDVAKGFYVWGAQLETGRLTPTSYMGATGMAVKGRSSLAAEPTRNIATWSDPESTQATNSNVTYEVGTLPGFVNATVFADNTTTRYAVKNPAYEVNKVYTFSCFVKMDDGSEPMVGTAAAGFDMRLVICNADADANTYGKQYIGDGVWRVWGSKTIPGSISNTGTGFYKHTVHSAKGFKCSGYQIELGSYPTAYVPTTDMVVRRDGVAAGGTLVEEASTNLWKFSDPSSTASVAGVLDVTWEAFGVPGFQGSFVYQDASTLRYAIRNDFTFAVGATYVLSCYVKMDDGGEPFPGPANGTNCDMRIIVGNTDADAASIGKEYVGNGVWRIWGSRTMPDPLPSTDCGIYKQSGNSARGFKCSGFQFEQRTYPSSYIPTLSVNTARATETLKFTASGKIDPSKGTVLVRAMVAGDILKTNGQVRYLFNVSSLGGTNQLRLQADTSPAIQMITKNASGGMTTLNAPGTLDRGYHDFAMTWEAALAQVFVDGTLKASQANPSLPTRAEMYGSIGCYGPDGTGQWGQPIQHVIIYDRVLTETELAQAAAGNPPRDWVEYIDLTTQDYLTAHTRDGAGLTTGVNAFVDSLSIYDRPLGAAEVKKLAKPGFSLTKGGRLPISQLRELYANEWPDPSLLDPSGYEKPAVGTFARNSAAYVDGRPAGEGTTNLFTWSEDFTQAYWVKPTATATAAAYTSYNGKVASLVQEAVGAGDATSHGITRSITCTAGKWYTLSAEVKADGRDRLALAFSSYGMWEGGKPDTVFDINAGTIIAPGTGTVATVTPTDDGFFRITLSAQCKTDVTSVANLLMNNGTSNSYVGDGTSGFLVRNVQFEQKAYATAYVLSAGGPGVRADSFNHQPRFVDPSNSGVKGVLVEESHTNLALYSNEISNAYWTLNAATVQADVGTAPDGTLTADKLVEQGGAATVHFFRRAVLTADSVNTVLLYAKAAGRNWLAIEVGAGYAYFDIANGVLGAKEASATASIKPVGNGWYQCAITYTIAAAGNINLTVDLANGNGGNSYAGDGTSGILFWGVNATTKAYPLSEVMTTSATATMAADTLTVPTSGLLAPSMGSVILKYYWPGGGAPGGTPREVFFHQTNYPSANVNAIAIDITSTQTRAYTGNAAGSASVAAFTGVPSAGWHQVGIRFSAASVSLWQDGASKASVAGTNIPSALDTNFYLGRSQADTNHLNQPIAWVYFYNRTLSDDEMAAATAGNPPPDFTAYIDLSNPDFLKAAPDAALKYDDEAMYHELVLTNQRAQLGYTIDHPAGSEFAFSVDVWRSAGSIMDGQAIVAVGADGAPSVDMSTIPENTWTTVTLKAKSASHGPISFWLRPSTDGTGEGLFRWRKPVIRKVNPNLWGKTDMSNGTYENPIGGPAAVIGTDPIEGTYHEVANPAGATYRGYVIRNLTPGAWYVFKGRFWKSAGATLNYKALAIEGATTAGSVYVSELPDETWTDASLRFQADADGAVNAFVYPTTGAGYTGTLRWRKVEIVAEDTRPAMKASQKTLDVGEIIEA